MRKSFGLSVILAMCVLAFSAKAATLDSARQCYENKDFKAAALQYRDLLTFNWPKEKLGELYDGYTECLVITGQYDLAEAKIDEFIKILPSDPVAAKLVSRKTRISQLRSSSADLGAVSLDSAKSSYDSKNFQMAAAQYEALQNQKDYSSSADVLDRVTECLTIIGKYDAAQDKIDSFLLQMPSDPACEQLLARKVQIAFYCSDYPTAIRSAKQYLTQYGAQAQASQQMLRLATEAQAKAGRFSEQIAYIDEILAANQSHPMYAELRRRQGDTYSNSMKQAEQGRVRYAEALERADTASETYEHCAYRLSEIALSQAKALAQGDPAKSAELVAQSNQYLEKFLNHTGADQIYPANAKRRITALKKLKKFDEMEQEAARYLSSDNLVQPNEVVAIKMSLGELVDFKQAYESSSATADQTAIHEIKAAYYGEDFPAAIKKAQDFIAARGAENAESRQAQCLLIESYKKAKMGRELVAYVDEALSAEPSHPMYADFRKVQADALLDTLKQPADAQPKYTDAMAHSTSDSDVYEWCCYRAGESFYRQAQAQRDVSAEAVKELKAKGRPYMQEYLNLPSKDRLYPANVKRRMMAYNRLNQNDLMELEAARYLAERGDYNKAMYMQITGMLASNRAMKKAPDKEGAYAAFSDLRVRENEFSDVNAKVYAGITMLKSADQFAAQGTPLARVNALRAMGRKFLTDAAQDESLKVNNRLDAYYFLGDWAALKAEAAKQLDKADPADSATRAEMMNWNGIALAYQKDVDGALKYFDQALQEYDKNPQLVSRRSVISVYWGIALNLSRNDSEKARSYAAKLRSLPDCDLKAQTMQTYQSLTAN